MGKKLFVLLVLAMVVLVTISSLVLALTGHDDLVAAAFAWLAHAASSVGELLGAIGVIIVAALVCGDCGLARPCPLPVPARGKVGRRWYGRLRR